MRRLCHRLPSDSQLCVDGVIAIPHLGASTTESEENCAVMAVEELRDFLEKGEIVNSVNFPNIELAASEDAKERILVLSAGDVSEQIFTILANNSIKVAGGASNAKKTAAALIETASEIPADVLDEIKAIDGVYRVRVVK
jgi:D-3-phosphoglycerate dehydrogenase